jgi:hypothetical protein
MTVSVYAVSAFMIALQKRITVAEVDEKADIDSADCLICVCSFCNFFMPMRDLNERDCRDDAEDSATQSRRSMAMIGDDAKGTRLRTLNGCTKLARTTQLLS